jgi:hypothetical protein
MNIISFIDEHVAVDGHQVYVLAGAAAMTPG